MTNPVPKKRVRRPSWGSCAGAILNIQLRRRPGYVFTSRRVVRYRRPAGDPWAIRTQPAGADRTGLGIPRSRPQRRNVLVSNAYGAIKQNPSRRKSHRSRGQVIPCATLRNFRCGKGQRPLGVHISQLHDSRKMFQREKRFLRVRRRRREKPADFGPVCTNDVQIRRRFSCRRRALMTRNIV